MWVLLSLTVATLYVAALFVVRPNLLLPDAENVEGGLLFVDIEPAFPIEGDTRIEVKHVTDRSGEQIHIELKSDTALPAIRSAEVGWGAGNWSCLTSSQYYPGAAADAPDIVPQGQLLFRDTTPSAKIAALKDVYETERKSLQVEWPAAKLRTSERMDLRVPAKYFISGFECVHNDPMSVEANGAEQVIVPTAVMLRVEGLDGVSIERSKSLLAPTAWQPTNENRDLYAEVTELDYQFKWNAQLVTLWENRVIFSDAAQAARNTAWASIVTLLAGAWVALVIDLIVRQRLVMPSSTPQPTRARSLPRGFAGRRRLRGR